MEDGSCFTPELFRFLEELREHNEREWFQRNKQRYESHVREPFLDLIERLAPPLKKLNPQIVVDPRPVGGSMMRIYRDIRFSRDKRPYKTSVAAHFQHAQGKDGSAPAYYLHLETGNSAIGAGIWRPETAALKRIRDAIVAHPQRWRRITAGAEYGSSCGMTGASLKRPPVGYDPNHPLIEDLKRKDFTTTSPLTDRQVCERDLVDIVVKGFRAAAPLVEFLGDAVGLS